MQHFITIIIISVLLVGCNPDKNKRADPEKLKFSTTDDAEIFFKNLRQGKYDKEDMEAAKLQVFRHSDRFTKANYPLLQLALVVNWRYDEAYLLIEPNEKINTDKPIQVIWKDNETSQSGTYVFEYGSKEEHIRFAGQLYSSILDGHELEYSTDYGAIPFFNNPKDREVFRISMFDFYRLTGNL